MPYFSCFSRPEWAWADTFASNKKNTNMDTDLIRKQLQEEIAKTEQLILDYQEQAKPVAPDVAIGRISRMDAINNKTITDAALRQAKDRLHQLRHALSKVGSPDFGSCAKCKGPIPIGRILIRPESAYCVKCAK
jgi:DnaK suppressor protein